MRCVLTVWVVLVLAPWAWAQEPAPRETQVPPTTASKVPALALDRWQRLSEEEKARLRQRLEQFKRLPEADREKLRESLKRWNDLSPEGRKKCRENMGNLSPEALEMCRRKVGGPDCDMTPRECRRRVLPDLPEEERKQLRKLPPKEKREKASELLRTHLQQVYRKGLPAEGRATFDNLTVEDRIQRIRQWVRKQTRGGADSGTQDGPDFKALQKSFFQHLSPEERTKFQELPPEDRLRRIRSWGLDRMRSKDGASKDVPRDQRLHGPKDGSTGSPPQGTDSKDRDDGQPDG